MKKKNLLVAYCNGDSKREKNPIDWSTEFGNFYLYFPQNNDTVGCPFSKFEPMDDAN